MNRQQRRAQKNQSKTQAQFDEDVYREGFRDGATSTFKMAYAAVCLVLHRDYGFGQGRCHKVLSALDAEMSPGGQLTIQGAIDQVYDEIGLALNFDEPFDRIEKRGRKSRERCGAAGNAGDDGVHRVPFH